LDEQFSRTHGTEYHYFFGLESLTYFLRSVRILRYQWLKRAMHFGSAEEEILKTLVAVVLLAVGASVLASAVQVPEIDAGSGANALALIAGALIVIRGRRKR
jgi:hypothetical protein